MTSSLRLFAVASVLAISTTLSAPSASAQDYLRLVRSQLSSTSDILASRGLYRTHETIYDNLWDNEQESFTLTLRAGRTYAIYGACDRDCSDIDLWVYDSAGNLIDSHTGPDDRPVMVLTPRWTGTFRVRTRMYTCRIEPCYYGVAVSGS